MYILYLLCSTIGGELEQYDIKNGRKRNYLLQVRGKCRKLIRNRSPFFCFFFFVAWLTCSMCPRYKRVCLYMLFVCKRVLFSLFFCQGHIFFMICGVYHHLYGPEVPDRRQTMGIRCPVLFLLHAIIIRWNLNGRMVWFTCFMGSAGVGDRSAAKKSTPRACFSRRLHFYLLNTKFTASPQTRRQDQTSFKTRVIRWRTQWMITPAPRHEQPPCVQQRSHVQSRR